MTIEMTILEPQPFHPVRLRLTRHHQCGFAKAAAAITLAETIVPAICFAE